MTRYVGFALLIACTPPKPMPPLVQSNTGGPGSLVRGIDQLRWYYDAYGGASMSTPTLVQPDASFKFALSTTADQFFSTEQTLVNGRVAGAFESVHTYDFGLSVAAGSASGSSSAPAGSGAELTALAAPQALYGSNTPSVGNETRSAIIAAAGDVATSAMLAAVLDPSKLASFAGKQVLWGVTMVSVNPGWKTRVGYSTNLEAHIDYKWDWARPDVVEAFLAQTNAKSPIEARALLELQRCVADSRPFSHPDDLASSVKVPPSYSGSVYASYVFRGSLDVEPVVSAASPMGDDQALDLQVSNRTIRQTALQMAFALTRGGLTGQANAFLNFAKSKQLDAETLTNNIVVNAYSSTSGRFGFRFNPRVAADPNAGHTAQAMQVPTFPALLVIGMDQNEIHARVAVVSGAKGPRCFVVEPKLSLHMDTRWARVDQQCASRSRQESPCVGEEETEEDLLAVADSVNQRILAHLLKTNGINGSTTKPLEELLAECNSADPYCLTLIDRAKQLLTFLMGDQQPLWLPTDFVVPPAATPKPSIALADQSVIRLDYDGSGVLAPKQVTLNLAGDNLDQIDTTKIASPDASVVTNVSAKIVGKNLQIAFQVNTPGRYMFGLPLKDGSGALVTPALDVELPPTFEVVRTVSDGKGSASTDRLTFTRDTPPDIVKADIEKRQVLPASVDVQLKAGTAACSGGNH